MIEWNIFYKMLGIPEDITEPTYYDLLGLHPKTCSVELVDRMLHKQRNRLRQNIPGPQFIPLVIKFEKEKLERAAEVLRNPQIRQKYNKYLRQKAYIRKHEKRKEIAKQRLLNNARDIINSLLSPDKTLDDSKRPTLIARLKDLGIKESRINSLLERIPRPAEVAAMPGDEAMQYFITAVDLAIGGNLLTQDAELKIMALAKKLNIDEAEAIDKINQTLKERNAQRGESDVSMLIREFENRVLTMVPNGLATQDQYRLLLALARADNVPDTIAREVLNRCLKIVTASGSIHEEKYLDLTDYVSKEEPAGSLVSEDEPDETEKVPSKTRKSLLRRNLLPIALITIAIGIFVVSASLFMIDWGKDFSRPESPYREKASSETQIPARTEPSTPAPNTDSGRQGYAPKESEPTKNLQAQNPLIITAADVRDIYSPSTRKNELLSDPAIMKELLADLAMTMRLCFHRATYFTSGSISSYSDLQKLMKLNRSERAEAIAGQAVYTPMPPPLTDSDSFVSSERVTAEELLSSIRNRNKRIKRTQRYNPQSMKFIYRDLYQLSRMTDPSISQRLREIIPESIPLVAEAIKRTLEKLSGGFSPPSPITRFGQPASPGSTRGLSGRITQPQVNTPTIGEQAWEPDPTIIKLLAVTAHYAEQTASKLKNPRDIAGTSPPGYRRSRNRSEISCSPSEVGKKLLDELDAVTKQLILLAAGHPDKQYSDDVTKVTERLFDHKLACKTTMQNAAADLKAIGDLLILLIQQSEPGNELKEELDKARRDWQQTLSNTDNVIFELRESCYYNLCLWDILVKSNSNTANVSQKDARLLSNFSDSSESKELTKKIEQQVHQQDEALSYLCKGLNAYIKGHFTAAAEELNKARQSQYVVLLANSVLLTTLEDTLTKCEKTKRAMSTCKKCDGTGLVACDTCIGAGIEPCSQCNGQGMVLSGRRSYLCTNCQGKGYVKCTKCNGEGFEECTLCSGEVAIGSNEKQAIKDLIAQANYLYSGGLDFFTSEALEPSQKIQP
jgi:hypothetical protein